MLLYNSSLKVPGSDKHLLETYKELLPACPRIIDPANPANNLYLSGVHRSERANKWTPLADKINSLNLSSTIMQQHQRQAEFH